MLRSPGVSLLVDAVAHMRRRGATFADVRHVVDEREQLAVRDGRVERHFRASSSGFGVRVLVRGPNGGAWGFAARAGHRDDAAALAEAAEAALAVARAAAAINRAPIELAEEEPQRGHCFQKSAHDRPL